MQVNGPTFNTIHINSNKKEALDSIEKISNAKSKQLDDASLALIANALGSDISGLSQGLQNANEAVALLQIADGTLNSISQSADELNTLSVKLNSGLLNADQKAILENQADGLVEGIQNSLNNASFGGKHIFGQSFDFSLAQSSVGVTLNTLDLDSISISNQESIQDLIKSVQEQQITIGSTTNALVSSTNSISTQIVQLSASKSQISDADIAKEVNDFNQSSIKLSASLITQAHQNDLNSSRVAQLLS